MQERSTASSDSECSGSRNLRSDSSSKDMESFSDLLHKLREVHEREVDGWQVKVQELSNKKGCDTKRMEELFNRNQQMKEQQRLLTENIKTLENRLRAGLCDRCTVTQEVAKRRQQEFEASQIQSLQHISILAGEMNSLKKDNRRLKDEIRSLRAAHDSSRGYSDHSSSCSSTTEVKLNSSPDRSPSGGPVALVTTATSRVSNQPVDGDVAVKTEADQRAGESERRHLRGMNRSHFESYKPLAMSTLVLPSWRTDHGVTRAGERRAEGLDQRSSIPHQALLKNSSSSMSGEVKPRHVLHAPVPCRPQPIKSSPVSLPWPLSESSDWVTVAAAGTNPVVPTSSKLNLPHFPSMVQTSQQTSPRQQVFGSPWQKPSTPQPPDREPTVVFRLKSVTEYAESQAKPAEKQESPPLKVERVSGEVLKETYDGPLDLSDRGKSKSIQAPKDYSSLASQAGARVLKSPDMDVNTSPSANTPVSSPSPVVLSSSSCTTTVKHQEKDPPSDRNHQQDVKEQEKKEEVNGKTDQSNGKKVPVLTISLRPVVVLETLNSALQKQESLSSNGKSSAPADEPGSSSDEPDEEESGSGQEGANGCKRKRASVETETDRDSDTDNIHRERKFKITA